MIDFNTFKAGSFRAYLMDFKPVKRLDSTSLNDLLFMDEQISTLRNNLQHFLSNQPYAHVLLSGAKGCGKTSLVKALFNHFHPQGLKLVEVFKEDLEHLRFIIDELSEQKHKFLIFLDDLSFERNDDSFKLLKPLLDGGIEPLSSNLLFMVSSNYLHLIKHESQANNSVDNEDDKYALKERFGIWLSFYNFSQEQYLSLIDKHFYNVADKSTLHKAALAFATSKASRNGRIAKQFYEQFRTDYE